MLDRLPWDLLKVLPGYLHTLADFRALILTCRTLYTQCEGITSDELFLLATKPETGINPYPHLFLAVKARALSTHASQSPQNIVELHTAIKKGPEQILKLALKVSPFTKDDLRSLQEGKQVIFDLTHALEPRCGTNTEEIPEVKVCSHVALALINYWIYCELFSSTIDALYNRSASLVLPEHVRCDWFVYCVPDESSRSLREPPYSYNKARQHQTTALHELHERIDARFETVLNAIPPTLSCTLTGTMPHTAIDWVQVTTLQPNMEDEPHSRPPQVRNVLRHLGIDSLRLLLPGLLALPKKVREVIDAGDRGDVITPTSWVGGRGWHSLEMDIMTLGRMVQDLDANDEDDFEGNFEGDGTDSDSDVVNIEIEGNNVDGDPADIIYDSDEGADVVFDGTDSDSEVADSDSDHENF
jgi:hypothetical protein